MPSYLEAYRLSRAQAQEKQGIVAAETPDKANRATPQTPKPSPARPLAAEAAQSPPAIPVSSSPKSDKSNPLNAQSFAAAKLNIDKVQGSNESKVSKDKVLKWQSSDSEPTSPSARKVPIAIRIPKSTDRTTPKSNPVATVSKSSPRDKTFPREILSAGTPRKRIVSDEHWLSDHGSPQGSPQQQGPPPLLRETALYARPGSNKPDAWMRRKSTPGRRNGSSTEKKQVSFEDGKVTGAPKVTGNKDAVPPLGTRRASNPIGGAKAAAKTRDAETPLRAQSKGDQKISLSTPASAPPKLGKTMLEDVTGQPATAKDPPPIRGAWTRRRAPRRESFSSEYSTDERDSGPENSKTAPPKTPNGRLGAWLSQTPDPFVDKFDDPLTATVNPLSISDSGSMIAPRKTTVRDDPRPREGRRVKSYSENHVTSQSDSDDYSAQSNSALKRGGAQRSAEPAAKKTNGEYSSMKLQLAAAIVPKAALKPRPKINRNLASHADLMSVLSETHGFKGIVSARTIRTSRKKLGNATITDLMDELRTDEAKYIRELRTLVDGVIPVLLNSVLYEDNPESVGISCDDPNSKHKSKDTIIGLGVALERLQNMHKRMPTKAPVDFTDWAERAHAAYENYIKAWKLGFQSVVVNLAPADSDRQQGEFFEKGRGDRVDVAFLLKRPLVRLKYLARVLKGVDQILSSKLAGRLASSYEKLVDEARLKQDKEHARLEDEAASNLDATKVRDPETLAPLSGIRINRNRCVRARDVFDMTMRHSSGQRIDCHVMLFLRDDFSGYGNRGDVLISEVDSSSRWLLFPPAELPQLSARRGKSKRELVVMLRGSSSLGQEWRELMSLEANSEETASEWIKLLGSSPMPPAISAAKGFKDASFLRRDPGKELILAGKNSRRPPSPSEADVPIGEQSVVSLGRDVFDSNQESNRGERVTPQRYKKRDPSSLPRLQSGRINLNNPPAQVNSAPTSPRYIEPYYDNDWRAEIGTSKVRDWLLEEPQSFGNDHQARRPDGFTNHAKTDVSRNGPSQRPVISRRLSTVPSEGLLSVDKNRNGEATMQMPRSSDASPNMILKEPRERVVSTQSSPVQLRGVSTPHFSSTTPNSNMRRRSSSPLKYEYAPSSGSDASSAMADLPSDDDDDGSVTSESSLDDMVPGPRIRPGALKSGAIRSSFTDRCLHKEADNLALSHPLSSGSPPAQQQQRDETVKLVASIFTWSDKGMWKLLHPDECSIVVTPGIIEAFEMSAAHSAPNSGSAVGSPNRDRRARDRPLVALELTPLVPLRQSTAIDITIRSPPTANSQIRTGNNIMFRSRTGGECELLYSLINQARINNPTYVALQNARGPMGGSNWASFMDQQASKRGANSWWRLGSRKSSYRAGNTRRSASIAETVSSVTSMSSAISALKRFSAGSNMFNLGKSTVLNRGASSNEKSSTSLEYSSDSSTPVVLDPSKGSPAGITDMKIRLYEREEASKWRDMGPARLTIMHPPRPNATMISPSGHLKQEKRILVVGKTRGETLLDVTLGETSFERVARTGVAVKVWEQFDQMAKTGGVAPARMRVYMIQMKSEAEAAYTFSLVGRLRY